MQQATPIIEIARKSGLFSLTGVIFSVALVVLGACGGGTYFSREAPWDSEETAAPAASGVRTAKVQKGDTVYALHRRYGAPVRAIIDANNLRPPYHLQIGQRIRIPGQRAYVVRKGDTVYSIARRHGVDRHRLAQVNKLGPEFTIYPGQRLVMPYGAAGGRATQVASRRASSSASSSASSRRSSERSSTGNAQSAPASAQRTQVSSAPRRPIPKPPPRTGRAFVWPVKGRVISTYGSKGGGLFNDGINIAARRGTGIRAAEAGVVAYAGRQLKGFGNLVLLKHSGGWVTAYAHADNIMVERGDKIRRGQVIATVGSTGNVKTPQLHFEIRRKKRAVNPTRHLARLDDSPLQTGSLSLQGNLYAFAAGNVLNELPGDTP